MEIELLATKEWFENKLTGEVGVDIEYFIIHPELGVKIYLKPADNTAEAVLRMLVYDNVIKTIPK